MDKDVLCIKIATSLCIKDYDKLELEVRRNIFYYVIREHKFVWPQAVA